MTDRERRRAIRAPAKLAMEIKLSGVDQARAESINVSANGVYFSSTSYIAPLTKLQITLMLPEPGEGGSAHGREVVCDGVVVRTDPDVPRPQGEQYEIACYFTTISAKDQEHLEAYILSQLAF
ncbi:MAG: PilZ domain-containing protein [Candidatus Krumholzibacteria bacterium]|nr:PilZ domain-containing protein [Candidatus Krumholzibacteria bacterium]